ncbi:MAG: sodium:proton exchanger [Flavobacterium sp.]|nr:MAG: sodium:proton exchanger [Flavobacterium sp.]
MHESMTIFGITLVILGYGYFSKVLSKYYISGPMIFATVGILLSSLFFGSGEINLKSEVVEIIAEITLIVILFSDASALNLKKLQKNWRLPFRLLMIGLPITILVTTLVAREFFPSESMIYLLLLALVLAPTDAALGKAVVSDKNIPENIRSSINVESGLNDGIVFPVLITVLSIITSGSSEGQSDGWLMYVLQQVSLGAILGGLAGFICAKIFSRSIKRKWMQENYENLVPIALAIFSYYLAEHFGGNGFIAAFFSGLFLGNHSEELRDNVENFAESEGELLIMICFLVFGITFIPATIEYWDLDVIIFSILSLTVLRMIPVALSLIGKAGISTMLFIGWFGPRGIASILYVLIIIGKLGSIEGHEKIYGVMSLTILLSIFLHGLSAKPFSKLYLKSQNFSSKKEKK